MSRKPVDRKIKMIAFDLDGTLLTTDKRMTKETRGTLEWAAGQGICLLPATGRPLTAIPKEILELPGVEYAVTANGARIVRAKEGKTVWEKLVSVEKARKVLDIFGEYDTLREIFYDGKGCVKKEEMERVSHFIPDPVMESYFRATRTTVPDLLDRFRQEDRDADKVQAFFASTQERKEAWERLEQLGGISVTGALPYNIEVNAEGIDKGAALLWTAGRLGIRQEEILAFGDGDNDVEMIRTAGIGAAMSNAVPEVLEAADIVAGDNNEDGVARTIRRCVEESQRGEQIC